jgi:superfamily II DNA helicase RecQ
MGIDKPDVRFVFHADLPSSLDAYYQEIGRAGRDGAAAHAHMVFGPGDIRLRHQFIDRSVASDEHKRRESLRLDALVAYCKAQSCRRVALLAYFGETTNPCGNCDACLGTQKTSVAKLLADPRAGALLVRLKALRMQLAKQARVPAYVIFSDRSLIDMADRVPLTKWDFGEVHGVGAAKQEKFADIFLKEIKAFAHATAAASRERDE